MVECCGATGGVAGWEVRELSDMGCIPSRAGTRPACESRRYCGALARRRWDPRSCPSAETCQWPVEGTLGPSLPPPGLAACGRSSLDDGIAGPVQATVTAH